MRNIKVVQALNTKHMVPGPSAAHEFYFFNEIIDVATKASDPEDLESGIKLLFARKIRFPDIPFDYGLTKDGMVITHKYTEGPILYVLFEADIE